MKLKTYSEYIIFVDESGDHGLESIDSKYPLFVLNFCIFHKGDYIIDIVPKIHKFKFKYFGHDIVILHEHDIHKQKIPFTFLQAEDKRENFMKELSELIEGFKFNILPSVIKKQELNNQYSNPYELALAFCMERAHSFLKKQSQINKLTHIVVEKRGQKEDEKLKKTFHEVCNGNNYNEIKMDNFEMIFADKKINSIGLQLADLTVRPIGRYIMNPHQENRAWKIIEKKLTTEGIKVFPKK